MRIRMVVAADGEIGLFAASGTEAEASLKLPALLEALGAAAGAGPLAAGGVEFHRHGQTHEENPRERAAAEGT